MYQYLLRAYPSWTVQWLNRDEESRAAYDIKMCDMDANEHTAVYIEVKTSRFTGKNVFEISYDEWSFASKPGIHYHIYRVNGAGDPRNDISIDILRDPLKAVREQRAGLCLHI